MVSRGIGSEETKARLAHAQELAKDAIRSLVGERYVTYQRNESECELFIVRCNTSWIVPDFVQATERSPNVRSPPEDTFAKVAFP